MCTYKQKKVFTSKIMRKKNEEEEFQLAKNLKKILIYLSMYLLSYIA